MVKFYKENSTQKLKIDVFFKTNETAYLPVVYILAGCTRTPCILVFVIFKLKTYFIDVKYIFP